MCMLIIVREFVLDNFLSYNLINKSVFKPGWFSIITKVSNIHSGKTISHPRASFKVTFRFL